MTRLYILFFTIICCHIYIYANHFTTERINISLERNEVELGDSIAFQCQVTTNDTATTCYSKYAYIEIINNADSVMSRNKFRLDNDGSLKWKLFVPEYWDKGVYYIRAYTRLMQNFSPRTLPIKPIGIGIKLPSGKGESVDNCRIYPEGGKLTTGAIQKVVCFFSDFLYRPIKTDYALVSDTDTIAKGSSDSSGMATLSVVGVADRQLQIVAINNKNGNKAFNLPFADENANAIKVINSRGKIAYQIIGNGDISDKKLYLFHDDIGIKEIESKNGGILNINNTSNKSAFVFFLVDKNGNVISERIVGLTSSNDWTQDIVSLEKTDSNQIDSWCISGSFMRFDLAKVAKDGFTYTYPFEDILLFKGKIKRNSGKYLNKGIVNIYNRATFESFSGEIDSNGQYSIVVNDFSDGDDFFISAQDGESSKNHGFFKYEFEEEKYPAVIINNKIQLEGYTQNIDVRKSNKKQRLTQLNELAEITIQAKKIEDPTAVDTKKFYGTKYINLQDREGEFIDFAQIIRRMPSVSLVSNITQKGIEYAIISNRGASTLFKNGSHVKIMLDGMFITAEEAVYLDPYSLEDVEYLSPYESIKYASNAINGIIKIRTRLSIHARKKERKAQGVWYIPLGLTNI